jgi:PBP1b-binding outer membrane lipoprotein LpoB
MKKRFLLFLFPLFLIGCATMSTETSHTRSILPDEDDNLGGSGIESTDIRTVARKMAVSILEVPEIAKAQKAPKIALLPVKNSTRFLIDRDMFTKKIRIQLNENAQGKVRFLARDRIEDIMKERERKRENLVTSSKEADMMGVDFYLTGELMGLSKAAKGDRSDYISMSFQLLDAETSEIIWESEYEVKRVGEAGVVYQ